MKASVLMLLLLGVGTLALVAAPRPERASGAIPGGESPGAEPPWFTPDRTWMAWWRRWTRRSEKLLRMRVTPVLPSGQRASTAELLLPPSQIAAEGLRPDSEGAAAAQRAGPRSSGRGAAGAPGSWFSYNSSEATPLVPSALAWMTDESEMELRAGGGGLDMDVARVLSRLVAASYCNASNLPGWECTRCGKGFRMRRTVFDASFDLLGFVGYSEELNAIVVAFRGTDSHSIYNWVENMRTWRTDLALSYPGIPSRALVHGGFFYSYNSSYLAGNVTRAVAELVAEHEAAHRGGGGGAGGGWLAQEHANGEARSEGGGVERVGRASWRRKMSGGDAGAGGGGGGSPSPGGPAPTVFVSGHSLGGALATLCALDLSLTLGLDDVRLVTFGSPRVGNYVFAKWAGQRVASHWRFTHNRDIVPSVPPGYMGFHHVAQEVWVLDVLRGRTLVGVCDDSGEDPRCHNSACHLGLCTSLSDHLLYLSEMYSPHPEGC